MKLETNKIVDYVLKKFEIDISIYDDKYIKKILEDNMEKIGLETLDDLIIYIDRSEENFYNFYSSFLNNYSIFFRDEMAFAVLYNKILPQIIHSIKNDEELRIWSVGCSNGQEAYSLAIICDELKSKFNLEFNYRIIATDISITDLEKAKRGIYKASDMQNTKYKYMISYFDNISDEYHVKNQIKKNVYFSEYDIVTCKNKYPPESIYGNFDIVICNNLLIYYNDEIKKEIVQKLISAVKVDGYLVTSEAEIDYVSRITKEEMISCQTSVLIKT